MKRTGWFILLAPLATAGLLMQATMGCQDSGSSGDGGDGNSGTGASTTTTTNAGGTSTTTTNTNTTNTNTGGGGVGGNTTCGDGAQVATIQEITAGVMGPGVDVSVVGAVAMSQKFLVTKSSSGNCLWGVFVSAPGLTTTAANTGILVASYGTPASVPAGGTTAYCPKLDDGVSQGDAIPENVQPGDVVDIIGRTDYFLLSNCATETNGSTVAQRQISRVCEMTVTGQATPPEPAVMSADDVTNLSDPNNTAFHDQWGGVKIQIAGGTATADPVVGDYGIITLDTSGLQIGDKLYYRGYQASDACHAGPLFDSPTTWTAIKGFSYLNYCTWGLDINDKCSDFAPSSTDCTGSTCAPY